MTRETGRKPRRSPKAPAAKPVPDKADPAEGERLATARADWESGNWQALAALAAGDLSKEAGRDRLALFAAAGLAQTGDMPGARKSLAQALDWGCPRRAAARLMVSGAFSTLGRVARLIDNSNAARGFFEEAMRTANPGQPPGPLAEIRALRETARLGLLPEAAKGLTGLLDRIETEQAVSAPEAAAFRAQLGLLNHMLAIAQKRGQVGSGGSAAGLEARATSQLGQDLWVLEQTGMKRGGYFVEFGATDGVLLSNTYLLETEFGWNGLCAEPNPAFFERLKANRSCTVSPACIAGETGREVEFVLADEYGSIADYADSDMHVDRRAAFRDLGEVITLTTQSLDDFLKAHDAPRTIDYLSIDTEGSEYEILEAFPFGDWNIRLMTVEHNHTPMRDKLRALMKRHGFTHTEKNFDDWYVKTTDPA